VLIPGAGEPDRISVPPGWRVDRRRGLVRAVVAEDGSCEAPAHAVLRWAKLERLGFRLDSPGLMELIA
jgi:hypothetical protein